ncbi:LTA synthase family protein [Tissierella creatinophila]|uniref:Lipoteichoic acid synthase 2 n=1 Tax=Tissierella creatinophila DSM 6911 TaxID=1123403 RepID=A0A1U7M8B0_TISCR|nr:LTA synthase family protein [Tissierella creatinophila]OLS03438.1 lipoteichoic acid synthase 2 [Tissierella creatinophila DSM 6911]
MENKKRKVYGNFKNNIILVLLVLGGIFNDLVLRALTIGGVFKLKPIVTSISMILIISILALFLSYKNRNYVYIILSGVFSFLSAANYLYYTHFNSFISVTLFNQAKQLGKMKNSVTETLDIKVLLFVIPTVLLIIAFKRLKKKGYFEKPEGKVCKRQVIRPFVLGTVMLLMVSLTLTSSDFSRLKKQWNRSYLVEELGIYSYATADIVKSAFVPKPTKVNPGDFNEALKGLVDENNSSRIENEYTGILEGKDIYVIHYESAQNFAMDLSFGDGEVTPFLNKLSKEGLFFNNFYPQHSIGTSSDSEFTFNTSLYPINNGTVFIDHSNKEYESIQKLLNEKDYYTMSMHGNNGDFWNRDIMHENLGYQEFVSKDSYEIDEEVGLGLSDESFYKQSVQKIKKIKEEKKKPIMAKLISLSNHYPFDDLKTYGEFDTGYLEGSDISNYLKSFNYADKSLQVFVEEMDKEGLLENAVILIYGDHHAKISTEDYEKIYNYDKDTDTVLAKDDPNYIKVNNSYLKQVRKTPLIIWSKDGSLAKKVEEPIGMVDVLPTISNMLGVFNPYQMGKDIFNVEENTVAFPDGSFIDKDYYYSSSTSELYDIKTNELLVREDLDEDITPVIERIEQRLELSSNIINNDLIKYYKEFLKNETTKTKVIDGKEIEILSE